MRVIHVETGRNLYGGAWQVLYLMRGLRRYGLDQTLVCTAGSAVAAAATTEGFAVTPVPYRGDPDFTLALRLRRLLQRDRTGLLHVHSRKGADTWGPLAALGTGVPVVVTRRVDNPDRGLLLRLRRRTTAVFVAISRGVERALVADGVTPERVRVIHSAIDLERYRPVPGGCRPDTALGLPQDAVVAGVIAQLIERKGHRHLLAALPRLVARFPRLYVVLFGKGPLRGTLAQEVTRLGLGGRVVFAGFVESLARTIPCLDLVVHPALMEGLGVSLLEASACEVPVVAAAAGGIPEVVRDGVNGLLVPPGDSGALHDAVARLLEDPAGRAAMGHAGRELVAREFSIEGMAAAYWRLYGTLVDDHGG